MGIAVDIEGNCRFYDLIRLKKLAKISAKAAAGLNMPSGLWRMLPTPVMCTTGEAFFGVTCNDQKEEIKIPEPPQPPPQDPKNPQPVKIPEPYVARSQSDILVKGQNSNAKENLKSLDQISKETPEGDLFIMQKGCLSIYRFEDVLFSLFNHLTVYKRRGTSGKEVFMQHDPFVRKDKSAAVVQQPVDLGMQLR